MTIERALRALAGFLVTVSVALGYWVHPGFFLFTAFVGLNLLQSAFTNACPAMLFFRRLGLRACVPARLDVQERHRTFARLRDLSRGRSGSNRTVGPERRELHGLRSIHETFSVGS